MELRWRLESFEITIGGKWNKFRLLATLECTQLIASPKMSKLLARFNLISYLSVKPPHSKSSFQGTKFTRVIWRSSRLSPTQPRWRFPLEKAFKLHFAIWTRARMVAKKQSKLLNFTSASTSTTHQEFSLFAWTNEFSNLELNWKMFWVSDEIYMHFHLFLCAHSVKHVHCSTIIRVWFDVLMQLLHIFRSSQDSRTFILQTFVGFLVFPVFDTVEWRRL